MKQMEKLLKEYFAIKGEANKRFRVAMRKNIKTLGGIKGLREMTKLLSFQLTETAFINDAETIKAEKFACRYFDFNNKIGVAGGFRIGKVAKKSLVRFLVHINKHIEFLGMRLANETSMADHREKQLSMLLLGKAIIIPCPVCKGQGATAPYWGDDDEKSVVCWECRGRKKIVAEIKEKNKCQQ